MQVASKEVQLKHQRINEVRIGHWITNKEGYIGRPRHTGVVVECEIVRDEKDKVGDWIRRRQDQRSIHRSHALIVMDHDAKP